MSSRLPALLATWTIPQSDKPISQYNLQYSIHGTTIWGNQVTISGSSPRNSTFLTRLRAGTEYAVRVRAVSAVGAGNWSAVQTKRTYMSEFFSMIPISYNILTSYNPIILCFCIITSFICLSSIIIFCFAINCTYTFCPFIQSQRIINYSILLMHGSYVSMQ